MVSAGEGKKFCVNCGCKLDAEDVFCFNCGGKADVIKQAEHTEQQPVQPVQQAEQQPVQPVQQAEQQPVQPVQQSIQKAASMPVFTYEDQAEEQINQEAVQAAVVQTEDKPKRKFTFPLKTVKQRVLTSVALVVVILVVVGVFNASAIENFFKETFSSPEEYYHFVENKNADSIAETFSSLYERVINGVTSTEDRGGEGEIKLELGEESRDMLTMTTRTDLSWLSSIALSFSTSIKENAASANARALINDKKIASVDIIADSDDKALYLKPEDLTDKYLGIDIDKEINESGSDLFEKIGQLKDLLSRIGEKVPDSTTIENLISKYSRLAVSCVDKVTKSESALSAVSVTNKYTTLEVELDGKTLRKIAETILKEMKDDEEIKKIFESIGTIDEMNLDSDEAYERFRESIEDALDETEEIEEIDEEIEMTLWVDGKGEVRGRVIETPEAKLTYAMPIDGRKFGLELSLKTEYDKYILSGSGERSGASADGEFVIKADGEKILTIGVKDLELLKLRDGYLNGIITVKLPSSAGSKMDDFDSATVLTIISKYVLELDFDMSKDSSRVGVSILDDEERLGTISFLLKWTKGSDIKIPESGETVDASDDDESSEWVDNFEFDTIISNLRDAGVDSDLIDEIENGLDNIISIKERD